MGKNLKRGYFEKKFKKGHFDLPYVENTTEDTEAKDFEYVDVNKSLSVLDSAYLEGP